MSTHEHDDQKRRDAFTAEAEHALDALLASQTSTEIDEAVADRLLSFLEEAPVTQEDAPKETSRPLAKISWAVLAAGLAAGLALWAWPSSPTEDSKAIDAEQYVKRDKDEPKLPKLAPKPATAPKPVSSGANGDSLLLNWKPRAHWQQLAKPDSADLLAAFRGRTVIGINSMQLLRKAKQLLRSVRSMQSPQAVLDLRMPKRAQPIAGPSREDAHTELCIAAARWLCKRVKAGWSRSSALEPVAAALLESHGRLRVRLVSLLRRVPASLPRLLASNKQAARLSGALGWSADLAELAKRKFPEIVACAREARSSGDAQCLGFLADLASAVLKQQPNLPVDAWFEGLDQAQTEFLREQLTLRARQSAHRSERERLLGLQQGLLSE
ncbi:MAG: hypothetical protein CSA62_00350 [Planctomycetota bacterium]|nr:MAG: hypothetical protein CSA62_00350 [Planctomycetota bacterium]